MGDKTYNCVNSKLWERKVTITFLHFVSHCVKISFHNFLRTFGSLNNICTFVWICLACLRSIISRLNRSHSIWWLWRNTGYLFVWLDKQQSVHTEYAVKRWFDNEGFAGSRGEQYAFTVLYCKHAAIQPYFTLDKSASFTSINSASQTTAQVTDSWKTGAYIIHAGFFKNDTWQWTFIL